MCYDCFINDIEIWDFLTKQEIDEIRKKYYDFLFGCADSGGKKDIISSEFYYLRNNDLVYIEPLKYRGFRKSQSQLLFSALTTAAVIVNVYLKITE